jgi:hypothetical protein
MAAWRTEHRLQHVEQLAAHGLHQVRTSAPGRRGSPRPHLLRESSLPQADASPPFKKKHSRNGANPCPHRHHICIRTAPHLRWDEMGSPRPHRHHVCIRTAPHLRRDLRRKARPHRAEFGVRGELLRRVQERQPHHLQRRRRKWERVGVSGIRPKREWNAWLRKRHKQPSLTPASPASPGADVAQS